ncbi:strawberry notch-like NTP hydrolase domain-containing protein [Nostoc sp.]|uniref:strawberry notch-like NTP hydrolase domain-containing protein n=1 Tax=Nostoc sp. TaxID=1180 RepID=UPI002FF517FA
MPKQSHSTPQHQEISQFLDVVPLEYEVVEWTGTEGLKDALYESYRPQRVRIKDALPHPSLLCESAALALVSPPAPTYQPHLPGHIVAQGLLSEAQLESVIYAGLAHSGFLTGSYSNKSLNGQVRILTVRSHLTNVTQWATRWHKRESWEW